MKEKRKGKVLLVGAEDEENLALRYLGAELQKKGHMVRIIPCSNNNDFSGVLKELKTFNPDIVAVSMAFQSLAPMFLELIRKINQTKPEVHVTVGGHFPTFEFEKLLEYETIDSVIRFEGEHSIVELEDIALLIKTRPEGIDQDILTILQEMGTVGVFLGVENASDSGLKALARSSTVDEINHSLKLLEDFNMGVTFNLLMFHPRATLEEINENICFMNKNRKLAFDFGRAEIVAGSPLEQLVKRKGLLRGQWPHWDYRIQDDAVEKMFRLNSLTFYRENSPYPELSHKLIALSYRSNLLQHFYPGKKSEKLQDETKCLIRDTNEFTLQSLLEIYNLVAEKIIEEDINGLFKKMNVFYENSTKKASEMAGKMGRFQLVEKKFQDRGVGDYFQNSSTMGKIFRI